MLPDVNVWLAMAFEAHAHHAVAARWFEAAVGAHWCRLTQQGFLRLATSPAVFGTEALTLERAWSAYDQLLGDERVSFAPEPQGLESPWRAYTARRSHSPKVWSDAYLAAFARCSNRRLITFDGGLASYEGVEVEVLRP